MARLAVDRADPENREFKHSDPIAWTEDHRGNILRALYAVMLGNPRLRADEPGPAETRFKTWWHLIGSAVEHGARLLVEEVEWLVADVPRDAPPIKISFREMFNAFEADEEQFSALATVLDTLGSRWPDGFKATELPGFVGGADEEAINFKAALEQASGKPLPVITATTITWRLKALVDAPVQVGDRCAFSEVCPRARTRREIFRLLGRMMLTLCNLCIFPAGSYRGRERFPGVKYREQTKCAVSGISVGQEVAQDAQVAQFPDRRPTFRLMRQRDTGVLRAAHTTSSMKILRRTDHRSARKMFGKRSDPWQLDGVAERAGDLSHRSCHQRPNRRRSEKSPLPADLRTAHPGRGAGGRNDPSLGLGQRSRRARVAVRFEGRDRPPIPARRNWPAPGSTVSGPRRRFTWPC